MERSRSQEDVRSYSTFEQGPLYPQIIGQVHSEEPASSYKDLHSISSNCQTVNSEFTRRLPQPQPTKVSVIPPTHEPECEEYCCACCCPLCFVGSKRGWFGYDWWVNGLLGVFGYVFCFGFPFNSCHALSMVKERGFKYSDFRTTTASLSASPRLPVGNQVVEV